MTIGGRTCIGDAVAAVALGTVGRCLCCIVAKDRANDTGIWVTEG